MEVLNPSAIDIYDGSFSIRFVGTTDIKVKLLLIKVATIYGNPKGSSTNTQCKGCCHHLVRTCCDVTGTSPSLFYCGLGYSGIDKSDTINRSGDYRSGVELYDILSKFTCKLIKLRKPDTVSKP